MTSRSPSRRWANQTGSAPAPRVSGPYLGYPRRQRRSASKRSYSSALASWQTIRQRITTRVRALTEPADTQPADNPPRHTQPRHIITVDPFDPTSVMVFVDRLPGLPPSHLTGVTHISFSRDGLSTRLDLLDAPGDYALALAWDALRHVAHHVAVAEQHRLRHL